jgi:hypothetical protein
VSFPAFEGADELLLSDPERAIGLGALGSSLSIFHQWFLVWCGRR